MLSGCVCVWGGGGEGAINFLIIINFPVTINFLVIRVFSIVPDSHWGVVILNTHPSKTPSQSNASLMLVQRQGRWHNISPALVGRAISET